MTPRASNETPELDTADPATPEEITHIERWFEGLSDEQRAVFDGLAELDRAEENNRA